MQHSETGGGILADEMGMGKSLSMLALITKTLESADLWAHGQNKDISESQTTQKRSRATLVIVPSARMSHIHHKYSNALSQFLTN